MLGKINVLIDSRYKLINDSNRKLSSLEIVIASDQDPNNLCINFCTVVPRIYQ